MQGVEAIFSILEKSRDRSILIWKGIPEKYLFWKMDADAMSMIETVRHVLDCDEWYRRTIVQRSGSQLNYDEIFGERPFVSIENELQMNTEHRKAFIDLVCSLSDQDLDKISLQRRSGTKPLGNFLLSVAYHEAFHAGQISLQLRMLNIPRPNVWD